MGISLLLSLLSLLSLPSFAQQEENLAADEAAFTQALGLFDSSVEDKRAAIDTLEKFLKDYRKSPRASDARFMVAEARLQQAVSLLKSPQVKKEEAFSLLRQAEEAYGEVIEDYKKSGLADSAQYRLGEVHYNRKEWEQAFDAWVLLQKKWPKSYLVADSLVGIVYTNIAAGRFASAEGNLLLLTRAFPSYLKEPSVLYAQGLVAFDRGDYLKAEKYFGQLGSAEAMYYAGRCQLLSGRPLLAASALAKLIDKYPQTDLREQAEFFIGDAFFLSKNFDGSIAKYLQFIEKYPNSDLKVSALYRIGGSYFQKKDYPNARIAFESLIKSNPANFYAPLAQYLIAESFLVPGEPREALFAYSRVTTNYPNSTIASQAAYKLAWSQQAVGDYPKAIVTCNEFLNLYPLHPMTRNVYLVLGHSYKKVKKYQEAVAAYQRVVDMAVGTDVGEQAMFSIIQTQHELKNYASILTSYQFLLSRLPPSQSKWRSLSYLYAADAYLASNSVEEAQGIYEMILKVYPKDRAAVYAQDGLAWCYALRGEDELAFEARQKLKAMLQGSDLTSMAGTNELGIADSLFNQKKYDDAFYLYDQFAQAHPEDEKAGLALFRSGLALYYSRRYSQAVETWNKVESLHPQSPEAAKAAAMVADTLFKGQKYDQAIEAYRRILRVYSDSPEAPESQLRIVQSYYNAGQDEKALQEAKAFLSAYPKDGMVGDVLDLVEAVLDRNPKMDYKEVLGALAEPNLKNQAAAEALYRLGRRLLGAKDYAAAIAAFERFSVDFTGHPYFVKSQFDLGEAYYGAGKHESAVTAYERYLGAVAQAEETAAALFRMGNSYYNLKNYEQAVAAYERLGKEYADSEFAKAALQNIAIAYKAMGDLDRAQAAYDRYYAANPQAVQSEASLWDLFEIQKEKKNYEGALEVLGRIENGLKAESDAWPEVFYRRAEIYKVMGKEEEMKKQWEGLKAAKPANSPFRLQALVQLGEAYEKEANWEGAVSVYEDIAKNSSNPEVAKAALGRAMALRSAYAIGSSGQKGASEKKTQ